MTFLSEGTQMTTNLILELPQLCPISPILALLHFHGHGIENIQHLMRAASKYLTSILLQVRVISILHIRSTLQAPQSSFSKTSSTQLPQLRIGTLPVLVASRF